ncbi:cytochrome p450 71a1 [Quercus suber]|uniref:Cytochrome p450 71a1 n=1 Tax=Quercus suber TaxID=58331 RepID=A0AAW0LGT3_QUESU
MVRARLESPEKVMVLLAAFRFIPTLKSSFGEIDVFLDQVVQQHMIMKVDDGLPNKNNFVDSLLELRKTLEWVMAELIRSPSIMKRAQEEMRRVVGTKSHIEVEDINQMNYLKCILKENIRLHPPLPLYLEKHQHVGYDIPPKTRVLINVFTIQRDPKIWDRPEEFVPDRFQDNQVDFKGLDFELIPFGGGRRGCPGMSFGVAIAEYLPSASAQGKDLDMTEVNALTVFKKITLELVAIPYSP